MTRLGREIRIWPYYGSAEISGPEISRCHYTRITIPNFWFLKVPQEGLYMIRMTWRIILINQNHFLTPIWNPNDTFWNFGLFWLNFHRLRFLLPEGARASILKMTAKSTSVGKPKNNLDLMCFWRNFGKKTTFLLIWVLTSFLKGFWSKSAISGSGRNFCHIAEISIFPYPE